MAEGIRYYDTGKRKSAIARVWLMPGNGKITINRRPLDTYFPIEAHQTIIAEPFRITQTSGQYDALITVHGGGISGQAAAIRHGISKSLLHTDATLRPVLKQAGFLTRDSRVKERKKYGQKKARKRFQYSKR
ncbi:MAG: 30S ribosomal protein S9 [Candidatus Tectomicrobia bacterium]|uniref:Small ribosomal subunit protein uS9 n=1 Tax=Tectimicrobiota bacterium TaxID=2528274 RepID=A0A937W0L5_UNCTE|nr:30S ribosomal protein S9 [Candidatus Tectomicrobia bacterium]